MRSGTEWLDESASEAPVYAVRPPAPELRAVVDAAADSDGAEFRVVVDDDVVETLQSNFGLDARLAGRAANGDLSVRRVDGDPDDRALIDRGRGRLYVGVSDGYVPLSADGDGVVKALRSKYESLWYGAEPYDPTAPPWDHLLQSAEECLCPEFATELSAAVEAADGVSWSGTPNPVELSLLVAGRHKLLLHDVSTWAGDTELASPSSCSRTKQRLVDRGLLRTDRVPQGVGRPRQRLLACGRIGDAGPESLVEAAADRGE